MFVTTKIHQPVGENKKNCVGVREKRGVEAGEENAGVDSSKRLASGRIVGNYATIPNIS